MNSKKENVVSLTDEEFALLHRLNFQINQYKGKFQVYKKYQQKWDIPEEELQYVSDDMAIVSCIIIYLCCTILQKHGITISLTEDIPYFDLDFRQIYTYKRSNNIC